MVPALDLPAAEIPAGLGHGRGIKRQTLSTSLDSGGAPLQGNQSVAAASRATGHQSPNDLARLAGLVIASAVHLEIKISTKCPLDSSGAAPFGFRLPLSRAIYPLDSGGASLDLGGTKTSYPLDVGGTS
jgi:hypothetical protein